MGDVNDAREENRRMKARLKIAYSDEAWSMIGEIEGRKRDKGEIGKWYN